MVHNLGIRLDNVFTLLYTRYYLLYFIPSRLNI